MDFTGADILSIKQFNRGDIETVLKTAARAEPFAHKERWSDALDKKMMAALFYEPSTRTRLSFENSMQRLGGRVISAVGMENSSLKKGETLYDTGRMVENYADVIVMRHPDEGSVAKLAEGANVPVINAGDGSGEHPSQALLDLYTMQKERGKIDGLKIAMVGDLKFGRTVHSLALALSHFDVELVFVSPEELKMPELVKTTLREAQISFEETVAMEPVLSRVDVLYMTRVQQERFNDLAEYEKYRGQYVLTNELVRHHNPELTILHPLPRIWELEPDVDQLPGAAYFRQVHNAVAVRMALLSLVLGKHL
ncbi:aspartate carbamoyltransferase [Candidatus Peregrinibacteria bacterium CG_4_9_14_0_2_um_filter_53_11]|nr:MAG: aspartate carbamoyltransferase [Candidatus Peregrinibacteria bacterium CG_4_9_14_0_2_um_filter_53_11]